MTLTPVASSENERSGQDTWSLDEYVVVADLYLRRGRSSGVRDPEVVELARLTRRSPAAISRRLGNFDGTVRPGRGLKPVVGEALTVFTRMRSDEDFRRHAVAESRGRLGDAIERTANSPQEGPRLVDPESNLVEEADVLPPTTGRRMIRAEAQLVRRYRNWLDPHGVRLRGMVIPTAVGVLRVDLVDTALNVLIEAKAEASRPYVRYAIGQLYDYRRYVTPEPTLAMLLPVRLDADLVKLTEAAGVDVIWEREDAFTDSVGGRLTSRS